MEAVTNGYMTVLQAVELGFTMKLNKQILTNSGFDSFSLYLNHSITINQLLSLGFDVSFASSSGDPHIFPLNGNAYELPQNKGIYRMIQGDNIIINASTRRINNNEKEEMKKYFEYKGVNKNKISKLVNDGCFYDECQIICGKHKLKYNFESKRMTLNNKESLNYFSFKTLTESGNRSYNKFERCENITKLIISFKHNVYGFIGLELNYFSNPQMKYGMNIIMDNAEGIDGLLIKEYEIESMTLNKLDDKTYYQGKCGNNKIISELCIA